ncbi:MAG: asparagine synthase (glutamine-hydrolyzing) [Lentisphaerae bacterium GWF2_45_14]|nr:MAG: asparagine synthase (glutamine-hydrolyzing) [Lentisphaerae bacterium GWF2_45_14]
MCGIYGTIDWTAPSQWPPEKAKGMRDAIRQRGPDHNGEFVEPGIYLGMNRLAIIDIARGNQPIFNENRELLIVYNGELYNHDELQRELSKRGHKFETHCDTEAILHAFEEYGPGCLNKFNGMFAFVIYNRKTRALFAARDRLGIKPFYYMRQGNNFSFASEAKALLPLLDKISPDWNAVNRYFSLGYFPSPDSPFAGIAKLKPGTYLEISPSRFEEHSYWRPEFGSNKNIGFEEAVETTKKILYSCIEKEMMSEVPLGLFLSGGLDSSAIAAYSKKITPGKLHSFGVSFQQKTHDESEDSRTVARHLGIEHHEVDFLDSDIRENLYKCAMTLDEPFGDSTVLPLMKLSKAARELFTVVLTGWGGDEIFAGYPTYSAHKLGGIYRHLPNWLGHRVIPYFVNRLPASDKYMSFDFKLKRFVRGINLSPELQHFAWMGYFEQMQLDSLFSDNTKKAMTEELDPHLQKDIDQLTEKNIVDRILHLDNIYFLEGNGLFQADRITMANSLEARVPLLNNDLYDFVSQLPARLKMHDGRLKDILRQAMLPELPHNILYKPKKGFGPPSSAWLKGTAKELFLLVFEEKKIREMNIFRWETIKKLIDEHLRSKADHGRCLWSLLSFQLWYERFILNDDISYILEK